jgi:hypothetical protein
MVAPRAINPSIKVHPFPLRAVQSKKGVHKYLKYQTAVASRVVDADNMIMHANKDEENEVRKGSRYKHTSETWTDCSYSPLQDDPNVYFPPIQTPFNASR